MHFCWPSQLTVASWKILGCPYVHHISELGYNNLTGADLSSQLSSRTDGSCCM